MNISMQHMCLYVHVNILICLLMWFISVFVHVKIYNISFWIYDNKFFLVIMRFEYYAENMIVWGYPIVLVL